uniref:Uncharacterized protein n=1 Tax=Arundo donax TaxID=35708 RepID=A0A0A9T680_ARUDO
MPLKYRKINSLKFDISKIRILFERYSQQRND